MCTCCQPEKPRGAHPALTVQTDSHLVGGLSLPLEVAVVPSVFNTPDWHHPGPRYLGADWPERAECDF
jgi:hypothetical protein